MTRSGDDPVAAARRAAAADRDERLYARKRARQLRQRRARDEQAFDPAPPSDDDWTVADQDRLRRLGKPTAVGDTIAALVRRRGWDERLRGASAWSRWDDIVGTDMAARCEPVRLSGGTLVVRAESQVWATQLRYLAGQLQHNANDVLGAGSVRQVRIVVGPLGEAAAGDRDPMTPGGPSRPAPPQDR